jgi:hypothetical protein
VGHGPAGRAEGKGGRLDSDAMLVMVLACLSVARFASAHSAFGFAFHVGVKTARMPGCTRSRCVLGAEGKFSERGWKPPSSSIKDDDFLHITNQLGYKPVNALSIVNRTATGAPTVLQCYPLVPTKHRPEPFPTMYWLCDEELRAKVSALEYAGSILSLKLKLAGNDEFMREMRRGHQAYAAERWALLRDYDKIYVQEAGWESRLREAGIGGMRPEGYVKCLHIHYAHFLARSAS